MLREYIVEALDGLVWQVGGAVRFLERGEDAAAERAMARAFDFARSAAATMRELRGPRLDAAPQPSREADQ